MPARENVLGSIYITIMKNTAFHARPLSYLQAFQPVRTAARTARRTGYSGKRFIDFIEQHARVIAFVLEHCSERRPASIQDGFRHRGFRHAGCVRVANKDCAVLKNEPGAKFVQKVLPAVSHFGVDRLHPILFARPLCNGQGLLGRPVDALCLNSFAVRQGGEVFQAEVDADGSCAGGPGGIYFHADVGIPAAACVLTEAARAELVSGQAVAVPNTEKQALVSQLAVLVADIAAFEWNPSERLTGSGRNTPPKFRLFELNAAANVFLSDALNGVAMNSQAFLRGAGCVFLNVVRAEKFSGSLEVFMRKLVDEIPDHIALARHRVECL